MSEYDSVSRSSLNLKGVSDKKINKKKKKKDKEREAMKMYEQVSNTKSSEEDGKKTKPVDKRTKAEKAFDGAREKREAELIIDKASKTHKERIMLFNSHLDAMTEHFDIPKVSWTK
ncbi:protein FAM32A-like [Mizuhopecten yessoensis]|uniref:Protein FAM32A-like n=1 Tax=Mizuhopecten yessoensis TaxID=6573 RepID=A0A210PWI2_MIZYE|nr:protein FAM32A-like [Mizuhopecten yessoensis]OWF40833.1 Protein FAM32A-like [Mizuhopecten yessoensis]